MITDLKLIERVKNKNCPKSFRELTDKYENIFYNVVHNRTFGLSVTDKQFLLDQRDWLFLNCINKFDPSRNTKFSTMVGTYAKYMCLNYAKKHSQCFVEFDKVADTDLEKDEIPFDKQDFQDILSIIKRHSDPRVSKIFHYRYNFEKGTIQNWKKVSKQLSTIDGITLSNQGCINIHNKVVKQIKQSLLSEK